MSPRLPRAGQTGASDPEPTRVLLKTGGQAGARQPRTQDANTGVRPEAGQAWQCPWEKGQGRPHSGQLVGIGVVAKAGAAGHVPSGGSPGPNPAPATSRPAG